MPAIASCDDPARAAVMMFSSSGSLRLAAPRADARTKRHADATTSRREAADCADRAASWLAAYSRR